MTEDHRREIIDPVHAFKFQRCHKQHIRTSKQQSMAFDGSEVKDIFRLGGAFLRLKGIDKTNDVHAASVLTP
jgi:hypothetical protein